ncbi:MAG: hypothetical protein ACKO4T_07750 [Planctomycetaceae bacterium]
MTCWVRACLLVPCIAALARGADDHVIEQAEAAPVASEQQHQIDLGANFDANLFEQQGNGWVLRGNVNLVAPVGRQLILGNGRRVVVRGGPQVVGEQSPESPAFVRARQLGEKRLERIVASSAVSAAQQRKLRLAMESDIRRFAAAVDATRATYAGVRVNLNEPQGQKTWQQFQQDVQQCRQSLRQLFDAGSLFAAALASTLDAGQLAAIETEARARRSFRWRAMVVATLSKMDDSLGLTADQHELLERALIAGEPALRSEEPGPEQDNTHLQLNLVYMVLSGVDSGSFKQAMTERQWRTLALFMNQGKSMRSWIEQQGILDVGPAADRRRGGRPPE